MLRWWSFEAGRHECELWALRPERDRENGLRKLQWIQDHVVLRRRGKQLDPCDVLGQG